MSLQKAQGAIKVGYFFDTLTQCKSTFGPPSIYPSPSLYLSLSLYLSISLSLYLTISVSPLSHTWRHDFGYLENLKPILSIPTQKASPIWHKQALCRRPHIKCHDIHTTLRDHYVKEPRWRQWLLPLSWLTNLEQRLNIEKLCSVHIAILLHCMCKRQLTLQKWVTGDGVDSVLGCLKDLSWSISCCCDCLGSQMSPVCPS